MDPMTLNDAAQPATGNPPRTKDLSLPPTSSPSGSRHTPECLARRLAELQPILYRRFPPLIADYALDAAEEAGLRLIGRVQAGEAEELDDGAAWLRCIAVRAACRRQRQEPRSLPIEYAMPAEEPYARQADEEELKALLAAIPLLPNELREVVDCIYFEARSIRQAALLLDMPLSTLRRRHQDALMLLRRILQVGSSQRC